VDAKPRSLVKNFALAGLVFAEVYMIFTVASPRLKGVEIPATSIAIRIAAMAFLFGPFGLAIGTGVGLLVDGALKKLKGTPKKPSPPNTSLGP
jgi:hypothetical protein